MELPAIARLPLWYLPLILAVLIGARVGHRAADVKTRRPPRMAIRLLGIYLTWAATAGLLQGDLLRGAASIVLSPVLFLQMVTSMLVLGALGWSAGFSYQNKHRATRNAE